MAYTSNIGTRSTRIALCLFIAIAAQTSSATTPVAANAAVVAQRDTQDSAPAKAEQKAAPSDKSERAADKGRNTPRLQKFRPSEEIQVDTVLSFPSDI